MSRRRNTFGTVWSFKTKRLEIALKLERVHGYKYDGDDEYGVIQAKLDSEEYVAFDSEVTVTLRATGDIIGRDNLGESVYDYETVADFYTSHHTSGDDGRNTLALREKNACICHYFPDMVQNALNEARRALPLLRRRT